MPGTEDTPPQQEKLLISQVLQEGLTLPWDEQALLSCREICSSIFTG